jgi:hypothetical protein
MKNQKMFNLFLFTFIILGFNMAAVAQTKTLIKRTNYKTETIEFGVGGTISIIGAPNGSIKVEGWQKNAVEISAEVEMQADSEADLAELAKVNGFAIDNDFGQHSHYERRHARQKLSKARGEKVPKRLVEMPLK